MRLIALSLWVAVSALMTIPSTAFAAGRERARALVAPKWLNEIGAIAERHQAEIVKAVGESGYFVLRAGPGRSVNDFVEALRLDGQVEAVEPSRWMVIPEIRGDQLMFAFDMGPDPGGYVNQYAYTQVRLPFAHNWATGRGVTVAVLDTGINVAHPDLQGRCVAGYNAIRPELPPDDVPDPLDAEISVMGVAGAAVGHGTMIAGIIARVAPDCRLMPVKVLAGDGTGTAEDVIEGILWAVRAGADVLSISFGTPGRSEAVERAIKFARRSGVVVVASAGNDNNDVPHIPAALRGVISVTSVESDNTKSPYASFGDSVDLVAPGTGIRSTYWDGGYATWSGTSFAVPFVSGAAALLRELRPHGSPEVIARILGRTATSVDDVNPDYAGLLGDGLLHIRRALRLGD